MQSHCGKRAATSTRVQACGNSGAKLGGCAKLGDQTEHSPISHARFENSQAVLGPAHPFLRCPSLAVFGVRPSTEAEKRITSEGSGVQCSRARSGACIIPCQAPFCLPKIPEPLSFVASAQLVRTYWYSKKYFVRPLFALNFAHYSPLARCIL